MVKERRSKNGTTVPDSRQQGLLRTREAKVTLPCSVAQKAELTDRATAAGLSIANYLRSLIGWPLEEHGFRKDLTRPKRRLSAKESPAI